MKKIQKLPELFLTAEELEFVKQRLQSCIDDNTDMIAQSIEDANQDISFYEAYGHENMLSRKLIKKIDSALID